MNTWGLWWHFLKSKKIKIIFFNVIKYIWPRGYKTWKNLHTAKCTKHDANITASVYSRYTAVALASSFLKTPARSYSTSPCYSSWWIWCMPNKGWHWCLCPWAGDPQWWSASDCLHVNFSNVIVGGVDSGSKCWTRPPTGHCWQHWGSACSCGLMNAGNSLWYSVITCLHVPISGKKISLSVGEKACHIVWPK